MLFSECFANTQDVKLTKPTDIQNLYTNPLVFHCLFMPRKTISMIAFWWICNFVHTQACSHTHRHTHTMCLCHIHTYNAWQTNTIYKTCMKGMLKHEYLYILLHSESQTRAQSEQACSLFRAEVWYKCLLTLFLVTIPFTFSLYVLLIIHRGTHVHFIPYPQKLT